MTYENDSIGFYERSSNSPTKVRRFIPQVVEVHGGKGEKNLFVLISLGRKLDAKLVSARKELIKAAVVNVANLSDFEVQVVKNGILDIGTVAASTAWKTNAFLTVTAFHSVNNLFILA